MFKKIVDFIFNPYTCFVLFTLFLIGYIIFLDEEGAFKKKFLQWGPNDDAIFLGMKMDTWPKVIGLYVTSFLSALFISYYNTVSFDFIHSKLWNPAYTEPIGMSKMFATFIVTLEPIMFFTITTLNFFVNTTFQLQFILFQFLGRGIIDIAYGIYKVNQNIFTSK